LIGIHHGVSAQHLQAYLNEFTFRFNRRFYPFNAFRSLLGIAGDVKAPTYAELYSGDWTHPTCVASVCLNRKGKNLQFLVQPLNAYINSGPGDVERIQT
jgi:hypothetical protein